MKLVGVITGNAGGVSGSNVGPTVNGAGIVGIGAKPVNNNASDQFGNNKPGFSFNVQGTNGKKAFQ